MTSPQLRRIFHHGTEQEAERIRFLERERGAEAAAEFARQTRAAYRRAVVMRSPPAGEATFRLRLIASYCYFKRYLAR